MPQQGPSAPIPKRGAPQPQVSSAHPTPHAVQFALSRGTHAPSQHKLPRSDGPLPGLQTGPSTPPHRHSPPPHTKPAPHTTPQPPQFIGSDKMSRHICTPLALAQHPWPSPHDTPLVPHPQTPMLQVSSAAQTRPTSPQLLRSKRRSEQMKLPSRWIHAWPTEHWVVLPQRH